MCFRRSFASLLPILLFVGSAFSQKPYIVELPAAADCALPDGFRLSEVFVVCRENIGYRSGINGTSVIFMPEMAQRVERSLNVCAPREGRPIAIKLNRMSTREFGSGYLYIVSVNLDILEERDDGWHLLYNAGSQKQCTSLKKTGRAFLTAIQECLSSFGVGSAQGRTMDILLREEELAQMPDPDHLHFPILEGDLPVGLFPTFMDLREKRAIVPSLKGPFNIKKVNGKAKRGIWGYSDGLKIFVRIERKYIPLSRGKHVLQGRIRESQGDPAVNVVATSMFGLLGALAVHKPPIEYEVNVDLLAGEFDRTDQTFDDRTVLHAIQYTRHSKSTDPLFIVHRGDTLASLVSEQFCLIRCRPELKDLEIEIATRKSSIPLSLPLDKVQPKAHLVDVEDGLPVKKPVPIEMNGKLLERLRIEHQQPLSREL